MSLLHALLHPSATVAFSYDPPSPHCTSCPFSLLVWMTTFGDSCIRASSILPTVWPRSGFSWRPTWTERTRRACLGAAIIAHVCALSERSSPRPATAFCLSLDFPEPRTSPGPSQVQHKRGMKGRGVGEVPLTHLPVMKGRLERHASRAEVCRPRTSSSSSAQLAPHFPESSPLWV